MTDSEGPGGHAFSIAELRIGVAISEPWFAKDQRSGEYSGIGWSLGQAIAKALGDIARAKGMSQLARDTGLGRESLYKALSGEGNPSFATILKVMGALGVELHVKAHADTGVTAT